MLALSDLHASLDTVFGYRLSIISHKFTDLSSGNIVMVTHTSAESWFAMQAKLDLWKVRQTGLGSLREFPKVAV